MSTTVRDLQAKKAATLEAAGALLASAEAADRDLSAEELAQHKTMVAAINSLTARIERAREQETMTAGLAVEQAAALATAGATHPASSVTVGAARTIGVNENVEQDPKRGFKSLGDLARAVHGATMEVRGAGPARDPRLAVLNVGGPLAAAPTTFGNEGAGADGGFLIPPGFSSNIFMLALTDGSLLPYCDDMTIDGNSMAIPKDETTPWGTNGIRAFWQGEALAGTQNKPVLGMMDLRLKKLLALVPISDELSMDTSALDSYLPKKIGMSIQWKMNDAILFGAGAGLPQGALVSGAVVTQAKDSGQATATLSALNLANMISRLPPGSFPNAIWIINNAVLPALFTMTLGNFPIYMPAGANVGGIQNSPYGMLLGRPIMVSQHAKAFSSQGDVILVDLSYYQAITKAQGMNSQTSMHLYFDADAVAFRTTFRMDGQSKIAAAISPANGSTTLSPFVQLAAR